jgi:hypothetical protein
MSSPRIALGTPRRLPKPDKLQGRVAVLDIAFSAGTGKQSFEKVTRPFIERLGERLAVWIDHHEHVMHPAYADDGRFILSSKAEHAACPEMITPERVEAAGAVDTVCCHTDFDGLCSAAKWIRGGVEPYPGADADARVIDTRLGTPSERARTIDRALRARPRDEELARLVVRFMAEGAEDPGWSEKLSSAAEELIPREEEAMDIAAGYEVRNQVAVVGAVNRGRPYDKTALLMLGQERAPVSVVYDHSTVTVAARFDSGIDLLKILELPGGMPTVASLPAKYLEDVLEKLGWKE